MEIANLEVEQRSDGIKLTVKSRISFKLLLSFQFEMVNSRALMALTEPVSRE